MDTRDIRNIQEAYLDVYEEDRNTMRLPGETNRQFKKSQTKNQELINAKRKRREDRMRNKNPRFIGGDGKITKTQREQVDLYDIILTHLLDEGYAETPEAAEVMMVNMSEEWMNDIVEGFVDPEEGENPSGRRPLDVVADHPKKRVRKKAVAAMAKQMEKEYGGKWKTKHSDPVDDD